jgi:hypothetical protein
MSFSSSNSALSTSIDLPLWLHMCNEWIICYLSPLCLPRR